MTIICIFEYLYPKLKGSAHLIKIIIDPKNLKYFIITKQLFRYQVG